MKIKLRPFIVPNFVLLETGVGRRQDGFKESPSYPLKDVPAEDLAQLCDEFRAEVFRKAGKIDPTKEASGG